jgi:muramidase (phage lysozyme)
MPTVLEELVVTLGLDSSNFRQQAQQVQAVQGQAAQNSRRIGLQYEENARKTISTTGRYLTQSEQVVKNTLNGLNRMRSEIMAVFSTLALGFGTAGVIGQVAKIEAQTVRAAKNIGVSAKELNTWQEAAKRFGGSAEGVTNTMQGLVTEFETLKITGQSEVISMFRALGIQVADAEGKMRPLRDIWMDLSGVLSRMPKPEANTWGALLHLDPGFINLLHQGKDALRQTLDQVERLGTITDQQGKDAIAFEQQMANMSQAAADFGRTLLGVFINDLTRATEATTAWIAANKGWLADEFKQGVRDTIDEYQRLVVLWNRAAESYNNIKTYVQEHFALWSGSVGAQFTSKLNETDTILNRIGETISEKWSKALQGILNLLEKVKQGFTALDAKDWGPESPFWRDVPEDEQLKYPNSPASRRKAGQEGMNPNPYNPLNPGSWMNRPGPSLGDASMGPEQTAFLKTLSGPESGGRYDILNGGETFDTSGQHPNRIGRGGTSTAAGRYQFTAATWNEYAAKLGLTDMRPENQDRAAWALASDEYRKKTGRDLQIDIKAGGHDSEIAAALRGRWPSLPGGSQSSQTQDTFNRAMQMNTPGGSTRPEAQKDAKSWGDWFKSGGWKPDPGIGTWLTKPMSGDPVKKSSVPANSNVETHINGPITVNTQATDAEGVAKGLNDALVKYTYVNQANTGLA